MKAASHNIEAMLLTTYGFEMQVLEPVLNTGFPLFVVNRDETPKGSVNRNYYGFKNFTHISPPKTMSGYGVYHIKLWLIKFKHFLRVVVCTSNQHLMDWAMWQNSYWFHDCPLQTTSDPEPR